MPPPTPPGRPLVIHQILGRNNVDPPQELAGNMAVEVLNCDYYDGGLGRKRNGGSAVTLNGFSANGNIAHLFRYLPSDDETAAELWAVDNGTGADTTMQRLASGTTWATVALADAIQGNAPDTSMVNFNGKLFMAYNTSVNRLHVYPSAGGTHRRVGFATPAAPTTALGAGAVTDTRQYAVQWEDQTNQRRSNIGTKTGNVALTAQQTTVTRPTAPSDGETHWRLYVYTISDNYTVGRYLNTTAIGTTTATDNSTSLTGAAPPEASANMAPPSAKYLLTDGTHLLGAGAWETSAGDSITPSVRMVWWTPALGTTDNDGDDERVSNSATIKTYLYVEEGITGLGGPVNNTIYVFAYRRTWKLIPTGQANNAYERVTLRTDIGCIRHQTIVMAEDEGGRPALYWLSAVGPWRVGATGIEYLGRDIEDRWAAVNLGASNVVGWGLFVPRRHQIWWHVAVGSSQNTPNERLVYDTRLGRIVEFGGVSTIRYGWARHTGVGTETLHGCLFANTLGASMSRDLLPYVGRVGTGISAPTLWKMDTTNNDGGTNFQGYVLSRAFSISPGHYATILQDALLLGQAASGVTITLTVNRDFGVETVTSTAVLTAAGSETRVQPKLEGAALGQGMYVQFQIGDGSAANNNWSLDALTLPMLPAGTI